MPDPVETRPPEAQVPARGWSGDTKRRLAVAVCFVLSVGLAGIAVLPVADWADRTLVEVNNNISSIAETPGAQREDLEKILAQRFREYQDAIGIKVWMLASATLLAYTGTLVHVVGGYLTARRKAKLAAQAPQPSTPGS